MARKAELMPQNEQMFYRLNDLAAVEIKGLYTNVVVMSQGRQLLYSLIIYEETEQDLESNVPEETPSESLPVGGVSDGSS